MSDTYDLRESYIKDLALKQARMLDFDAFLMWRTIPDGLHFRRNYTPDKRFKNWRDTQAYLDKVANERAKFITTGELPDPLQSK